MQAPTVDATTQARRDAATRAAIRRIHTAWHRVRNLDCAVLDCGHAWYPR